MVNKNNSHLCFEDLSLLMKILTPCRLKLLNVLRHQGPLSVRALAKVLERDYKNVHLDTKTLEGAGLLDKLDTGQLTVSWDSIEANLTDLDNAKSTKCAQQFGRQTSAQGNKE